MAVVSSVGHFRKRQGLKQAELAERLGMKRYRLSMLESGAALPTLPEVDGLARELEVVVSQLYPKAVLEAITA